MAIFPGIGWNVSGIRVLDTISGLLNTVGEQDGGAMLVTDFKGMLRSGKVDVVDFVETLDDSDEMRRFLVGGTGVPSFSFSHSAEYFKVLQKIINGTENKIHTLEFFRVCRWGDGTALEQLLASFQEASFFYNF
jgi:hypothetical protein